MPFALLDDKFHSNAKILAVGDAGAGLFARAISYCACELTDGWIPSAFTGRASRKLLNLMVDMGLWLPVRGGEQFSYQIGDDLYTVTIPGPGFFIPQYLALNPSRQKIKADREELSAKRSEAGKKGAAARWGTPITNPDAGQSDAMANAMAKEWQTDGPTPTPQEASNEASIFAFWRKTPGLIAHRDTYLDAKAKRVIRDAVRKYGDADVCAAISNYAAVVSSEAHWFSHRWTLIDFLKRGLDRFVPEAQPLATFRRVSGGMGAGLTPAEIATMFDNEEVPSGAYGVRTLGRGD